MLSACPYQQVVVWCFILINLGVASLFIVVGPKRLAQTLYDFSQRLANNPYGWLILGLTMGMHHSLVLRVEQTTNLREMF